MSIDGRLDDAATARLLLSNAEDFDRVDGVRAGCDAILVGAETIRRDNPRLLVRSQIRRAERVARGQLPSPIKVTVTGSGDLDPAGQFFSAGEVDKIVYCARPALERARARLCGAAVVLDGGEAADGVSVDLHHVTADLHSKGVARLMVEGGATIHTQFLTADLVDELHLVIAPFFVGDARAPRFVGDGEFPWNPEHRATLAAVRQLGDVALLQYALSDRFGGG
jgi:5-amino-6-(5-phosphoribosylamino)uracil reductase